MKFLTALPFCLAGFAPPALAEVPRVVTDIPAVGSLVQQVMGDLGRVEVLLPAGADAHDYQMRPSEARRLQDADLLIWVGPALTPWLQRTARSLATGDSVALLDHPATHRRLFDPAAAGDHGEKAQAADADPTSGADADPAPEKGATDPHAWLDPRNGIAWLDVIAAALSARDPQNAAAYAANADAAADRIVATEAAIGQRLSGSTDKRFLVVHDAYGYFTGRFGLRPPVALALGDAAEPSAARLSEIRALIGAEAVVCAFPEVSQSGALLDTVVAGTGAKFGDALDPSGSGHAISADLYNLILLDMGTTIARCLAGETG